MEEAGAEEARKRAASQKANWEYYMGEMKRPLQNDNSGVDDNVILPLCQILIEKSVAAMLGVADGAEAEGVRFIADTDAGQAVLDGMWEKNRKNRFLHNLFLQTALAGHAFVRIVPEADGVRLVALNPSLVTVFWDAFDAERVLWYRLESQGYREDIVRDDETWIIRPYRREKQAWIAEQALQWNYAFPPIVDWQNLPLPALGGYYGRDDLNGLGRLNDQINLSMSLLQRVNKNNAAPIVVVTGGSLPEGWRRSANSVLSFPNENAEVALLELKSDGSFSMSILQMLQRMFFNAGREVDPATVADKLGDLTNFALRILYQDVLMKRHQKWLEAGEGLARVCETALAIAGLGGSKVQVIPPALLPSSMDDTLKTIEKASALGLMSKETASTLLGLDPSQESDRIFNEAVLGDMLVGGAAGVAG